MIPGVEDIVDGFVGRWGIRSNYQQQGCWRTRMVAYRCLSRHNFKSMKLPFMTHTYDKNAQIDKLFCLYYFFGN